MDEFAFKELKVWHKALEFAQMVIMTTEELNSDKKHFRLIEQIEACAASISMNIAEGKGRYSKKEFIHYLYIARGSIFETVSLLNLFHKLSWIDNSKLEKLEISASEIGKMLNGLINSIKNN